MVDILSDLAYSTVLTAPSPATTGTSLVVQSGDGAKFPTGSFDILAWPPGVQPLKSNSEQCRATVSGDTFTITRNQYGSSAQSIATGWQICQPFNKNLLSQFAPLASPALTGTPTAPTATTGDNTTKIATTAFVIANAGGGGSGAVSSVFTRTGAVAAQSGDYNATQVPNVVVNVTQSATPAIDTDTGSVFEIFNLAQAITSLTTNLTGTPVDGQQVCVAFSDNGTARAITYGAKWVNQGATAPTTTIVGDTTYTWWVYSSALSAWVFQSANVVASGGASPFTSINATTSGAIAALAAQIVNTTAAATVTLPASATIGQMVLVSRGNHTALITITANTGQTINGGSSGGSVSMVAGGSQANSGQGLFIAESATKWLAIGSGTDLGLGGCFSGYYNFESPVGIHQGLTVGSINFGGNRNFTAPSVETATYATNQYSENWVRATSGTWTLTLTSGTAGQTIDITNEGSGVITVTPSSGTIDGVASRVMTSTAHPCSMTVRYDGTNWHTLGSFGSVT